MKTAVVTGGTGGLGRALCLKLGQKGYRVLATYHGNEAAAESLRRELEAKKISGEVIRLDVTSPLPPGAWGQEVDVLVHAACAPFTPGPFHLTDGAALENQMSVAVTGGYHSAKEALRLMVPKRRGTIVNVLSEVLRSRPKGFGPYLAAKSALDGLTKAIADEYRTKGIRAFSFAPGFMPTSLTEGWNEAFRARPTTPEKAADALMALIENESLPASGEIHFME